MTHIWSLPQIHFQAFDELEETRAVILVTTPAEWQTVETDLKALQVVHRVEVREAAMPHWMEHASRLLAAAPKLGDPVIYAVGGGMAVDAAKYLSQHAQIELACLPTALSTGSFFTWASSVRHDGCVQHIETRPPDRIVIDFDVIAAGPKHLRAAGICDVLSIATALWDWEYAEEIGRNPEGMELVPWAADAAMAILQGALDCAEAAGAGDPAGLKQLLDCLALEVQLCNLLGHSRPVEGSEHYFAYAVENDLQTILPQGALIGKGILLMAEQQDQEVDELETALAACQIRLDGIPAEIAARTMAGLPGYADRHALPYGIAHELQEEN